MEITCKKCGYTNADYNPSPTAQCPNCGAIYAKVAAALSRPTNKGASPVKGVSKRRSTGQKDLNAKPAKRVFDAIFGVVLLVLAALLFWVGFSLDVGWGAYAGAVFFIVVGINLIANPNNRVFQIAAQLLVRVLAVVLVLAVSAFAFVRLGGAGSFVGLLVLGTSVWVLFDAMSIGVKRGQIQGLGNMGPWVWFISCLLFWIVAFPFYLAKRAEFKRANAKGGFGNDSVGQLERLARLKEKGLLTDEEFNDKKKELL